MLFTRTATHIATGTLLHVNTIICRRSAKRGCRDDPRSARIGRAAACSRREQDTARLPQRSALCLRTTYGKTHRRCRGRSAACNEWRVARRRSCLRAQPAPQLLQSGVCAAGTASTSFATRALQASALERLVRCGPLAANPGRVVSVKSLEETRILLPACTPAAA